MSQAIQELQKEIEIHREKMILLASNLSMVDQKVVNISVELDYLLYQYQTLIAKKQ